VSAALTLLTLDIAAMLSAALLGARLLLSYPRRRSAQLIALICVCNISYIALSRYDYRYWIPVPFHFEVGAWFDILNFARNLTPGLLMILCFTLFTEKRRFPGWLLVLFLVQMLLEEPAHVLVSPGWRFAALLTQAMPGILQMSFALVSIYWAVSSWRADLVETRRRTRALTILVIGLNVIASSVLLRIVIDPNTIANYHTHVALIAFDLIVLLFLLSQRGIGQYLEPRRDGGQPGPAPSPSPSPPSDPQIAAVLTKLKSLMEIEHIYRQANLSLKSLAVRAGLPEYRLRKIIHEQLGYSNYNAFLHSHRVRDACGQLRDPAMRRIPILTIALSVGYQSVNTFNRGFRDLMGVTPSAYRSQDGETPGAAIGKLSPESE
jgi:AraC-like DNA-binding protein